MKFTKLNESHASKSLIGKRVTITNKESIYHGEWGIVKDCDEDGYYYVAIANGEDSLPIFTRNEFKVNRDK